MYFRYYSNFDVTRETISIFRAADLDAAWMYLSELKRLDIASTQHLYSIEYATLPDHENRIQ
jgi:hypothetical protein